MRRLSNASVRNARAPKRGSVTIWDSEVVGFGVRVYAGGARSFFLNYRANGRERRYSIGRFPCWLVGAARKRAKELRRGVDRENAVPRVYGFTAERLAMWEQQIKQEILQAQSRAAADKDKIWTKNLQHRSKKSGQAKTKRRHVVPHH